jgi:hypothetical protein
MKLFRRGLALCVLYAASLLVFHSPVLSQTPSASAKPEAANDTPQAYGQRDFDFEIGLWKIHLRRRLHPLTGSDTWVDCDGTSVTRKVWDGRSNFGELETDCPSGHIEGLTLRLFNPQSHQWSIFWANSRDGNLGTPMIGQFQNGRGEFYDQELFEGRAIYVRYVWSGITADSAHFEQSFSADGGKTWEANWISDQTRVKR